MSHINPTLPTHDQSSWDVPLLAALQAIINKANSLDDVATGLATVASSGRYADLIGTPTLATVAGSGAYGDLSGKPVLATVATSGSYSDLTDKPSSTGGTGGSQAPIFASTAMVYSSAYPHDLASIPTGAFVYVCDGTADEVEINAAINAIAGAGGGGKVQLVGRAFNIAGSIQLKTAITLAGEGMGTVIKATGSMTGMVTLFDGTVHLTTVRDLTFDGNSLDVHAALYYSASSGAVFTSAPSSNPDPAHVIENLFIHYVGTASVGGHGLHLAGANLRGLKIRTLRIQNCTGCGIWMDNAVDTSISDVEIGSSGSNGPAASISSTAPVGVGFYLLGANIVLSGCKAWYSRNYGYYLSCTRSGLVNCQAQDGYTHGFYLNYGKVTLSACHADSNGQNGAGVAAGFYIAAANVNLSACQSYDRGGQAWAQAYGFQFASGVTYSRIVGCLTYTNATASQTGSASTNTTVDIVADAGGK